MLEFIVLGLSATASTVSISATQILLALLIIMSAVKLYQTRDFSLFKKSYFLYFLLMVMAEFLSTIFGTDMTNSLKSFFSFWVYFHLFAVYLLYDGRNREKIFLFFFIGILMDLGYDAYYFATSETYVRANGFLSHALTYGNEMGIMFIAACGFLFFTPPPDRKMKILFVFFALAALTALILSDSRGSIMASMLTLSAMIIYRFRSKGLITVAVGLAVLFSLMYFDSSLGQRFKHIGAEISGGSNTSVGTRLVLWETTAKAIMAKPLFGYGKGNFEEVIRPMINVPVMSVAHAHNSYLQYTFTNGFFGLIALFLFISALFRHIGRAIYDNPYAKTALFVLIVYMAEGLTENNFTDSEVVMAAFFSIALLITPLREQWSGLLDKKNS